MPPRLFSSSFLAVAVGILAVPDFAAAGLILEEDFGNFPNAVEVTGEFGDFVNLNINGTTITDYGFLFQVQNTSWGVDGDASAFEADPDGDFAENDVLTPEARAAIEANQPFGIFAFGAHLPDTFEALLSTSTPMGWSFSVQDSNDLGFKEFNFEADLNAPWGPADRLLFDPNAEGIHSAFTNPQTGTYSFFISAPDDFVFDDLPQIRNSPGLDVRTNMVWWDSTTGLATEFGFNDQRMRPRGEIQGQPIPEPSTALLLLLGTAVALAAGVARRFREQRA